MKKLIYITSLSFYLFIQSLPVMSQDYLVDFVFLGSRSKFELLILFGQAVDYDVDLYKVRYKTADANGQLDTASGLLVLPQVPANTELPIVVYAHGTTSGPTDVPSQLRGGYEVAMAYAASGFATVAPDYLGLGDARGFHPYLHAATEASASLDMLFAGYEYLEFHDPDLDPNYLFLAGYSQGGHASMALHREIDQFWQIIIPVTAATHMSGPYSISDVMRDRVLSDDSYGFPSYIAYIFLSYNDVYDIYGDLGEVFKEPFATSIERFYNREITLSQLNGMLIDALLDIAGDTIVKRMLQDSIVDVLTNDLNHPLNMALQENDTYNWAPSSPTRLYYCGADQQVPPRNSIIADSVMNALGAADVQAINLNNSFDHGPCVFPAIMNSVEFFLSFVNPSSVDNPNGIEQLTVYPNPSVDEIVIDWENAASGFDYQIVNTKGQIVKKGSSSDNRIAVKEIPAGLYIVVCTADNERRIARMFRR